MAINNDQKLDLKKNLQFKKISFLSKRNHLSVFLDVKSIKNSILWSSYYVLFSFQATRIPNKLSLHDCSLNHTVVNKTCHMWDLTLELSELRQAFSNENMSLLASASTDFYLRIMLKEKIISSTQFKKRKSMGISIFIYSNLRVHSLKFHSSLSTLRLSPLKISLKVFFCNFSAQWHTSL